LGQRRKVEKENRKKKRGQRKGRVGNKKFGGKFSSSLGLMG